MIKPNIDILLNNNPKCNTKLESTTKKQVWYMKNEPYICIDGSGFSNGEKNLKVIFKDELLANRKIDIIDNSFKLKVILEKPLNNPQEIRVVVDDTEYYIEINLKRLYGTVKYFNGQPVKNPIISLTEEDIVTIGDEKGNYEVYLHGKINQIGVFEKNYSKKTLETWIHNIDLDKDYNLDIKLDKMEVYKINMWDGQVSDYLHFIPMSLNRMKEGINNSNDEIEIIKDINIWPQLNEEDIKLFADNHTVEILSITEAPDFIAELEGEKYYRPSYVLSIPKGYRGTVIKIQIENTFKIDNKKIIEKGEGYYIWI